MNDKGDMPSTSAWDGTPMQQTVTIPHEVLVPTPIKMVPQMSLDPHVVPAVPLMPQTPHVSLMNQCLLFFILT